MNCRGGEIVRSQCECFSDHDGRRAIMAHYQDVIDEKCRVKTGVSNTHPRMQAFYKEWREYGARACFQFTADCGGDSIALCLDCLRAIAAEVETAEAELSGGNHGG
jgi:hypothetical protein